jgi:hypothetical protein
MSAEQTFGQEFDQPEEGALQKEPDTESYEDAAMTADSSAFEVPAEEIPAEAEAAEMEQAQLLEVPEGLQEIFDNIEGALSRQAYAEEGAVQAEDAYEGTGNIVGVGFGVPDDISGTGLEPGKLALNVYVVEPTSVDEAKAVIVDSMRVSAASSDDVPVNVVVTGEIEAFPHKFKIRPAPGGVSVGHYRITAGTLGCLAHGRRPPRNRRLMILSNNHVLANSNNARFGDSVIQPGRYDGGMSPRDRVAILERFVPIRFGSGKVNYVDCATAWAWPTRVRKELVYLSGGRRRFFRVSSRIRGCQRGLLVGKSGRTTQLTVGRITDCTASLWVNYGGGRRAFFRDQMVIASAQQGRRFSAPGDSGSLIWTWNRTRNPVGLLFAGGGGYTIANKISRVLAYLDIQLYT